MSEVVEVNEASAPGEIRLELATLPQVKLPKNPDKPFVANDAAIATAGLEAYKSLRTRLLRSQAIRGFRSVAVTSASQSDGKTLTSINLAYCCSQLEDISVLLVDADLRTRGLTSLIGNTSHAGLANVLSGEEAFESAISGTDMPKLAFMHAGESALSPAELFSGSKWKEFMNWAARHFDLVIVDSQPSGVLADFELIAGQCDSVLLVVRALRTSREDLQEAVAVIDPKKLIGVIWNGAETTKKSYYYEPR